MHNRKEYVGLHVHNSPPQDNINTGRERTGEEEKVYGSFKISSFANLFNFPLETIDSICEYSLSNILPQGNGNVERGKQNSSTSS